ncbi:MAG: caspase family protein [Xanthomonadales bacterium]|nr:caspase family protein [Xanthomonadales bacterium]
MSSQSQPYRLRSWSRQCLMSAAAALVAIAGTVSSSSLHAAKRVDKPQIDELYVVDCLLPGQVRQLGGNFTYLSARRPIKTTARDCEIRGGEYVAFDRANYATALKTWLPAAQSGDADAMNTVGEIYEQGLGLEPDYELAAQWFKKAAEKGHSSAMINLGTMYEAGRGVPQDSTVAMNWYRKASGLTTGKLELVTEEEEARRRAQEQENIELRNQVGRLKGELDQARSQLNERKAALESSKAQLEQARSQLTKLERESAEGKAAMQRLTQLETEVSQREQAVRSSETNTDQLLAQLGIDASQRGPAPEGTAPRIDVISPKLKTTRAGVLAAPLFGSMPSYQVIGRVYPAGQISSLKVNNVDLFAKVDPDGIFTADISLPAAETPVRIEAVTADGTEVSETFMITQQSNAPALAKRVTSKIFQRRMRKDLGNFHAVVIGNNAYSNGFAPLNTAANDAQEVGKVLRTRYGYQVTVIQNATKLDMVSKLSELSTELKADDNLLIYYAGHGQIDAKNKGYWIPVDGSVDDPSSWVSTEIINDFIGAMEAKHVLVIADSCYSGILSGSAIRPIPADAAEQDLLFVSRVKARTVLTSGGLQPVLDEGGNGHSVFAQAFLTALNQNDTLVEGYRLYQDVAQLVTQRSMVLGLPQTPQYTALKHVGHEGSEFFFIPKEA